MVWLGITMTTSIVQSCLLFVSPGEGSSYNVPPCYDSASNHWGLVSQFPFTLYLLVSQPRDAGYI